MFFSFQAKKGLEAAKESFDKFNNELMKELPEFFEGRLDYFQPCFEALIKAQVYFQPFLLGPSQQQVIVQCN